MNENLTSKFIQIRCVEQTVKTRNGPFCALKDVNLTVASATAKRSSIFFTPDKSLSKKPPEGPTP